MSNTHPKQLRLNIARWFSVKFALAHSMQSVLLKFVTTARKKSVTGDFVSEISEGEAII
jgi:hypothetical protein